jgi:hypothetical protein
MNFLWKLLAYIVALLSFAVTILSLPTLIATAVAAFATDINPFLHPFDFSKVIDKYNQLETFKRNLSCRPSDDNIKRVIFPENRIIQALFCPTSDILIELRDGSEKTIAARWIRVSDVQEASSFLMTAYAAVLVERPSPRLNLAQSSVKIMCQQLISKTQIVRIIQVDNTCRKEIFDARTGVTIRSEPVACNAQCPANG